MKLKKTPLVLALLALLLGGIVGLQEMQRSAQQDSQSVIDGKQLFDLQEKDVTAIKLTTDQGVLVVRKEPPPPASASAEPRWTMTSPQNAPAEPGAIAYLLNLLATGKRQETLRATPEQLEDFGLDPPIATIDFTLTHQTTHRLTIGKPTFNRTGLYAQLNPSPQSNTVVILSTDFENAINRPLPEWQAKPSP